MNKGLPGLALLMILSIMSFSQKVGRKIIDANATAETKALFYNLGRLSEKNILFEGAGGIGERICQAGNRWSHRIYIH